MLTVGPTFQGLPCSEMSAQEALCTKGEQTSGPQIFKDRVPSFRAHPEHFKLQSREPNS